VLRDFTAALLSLGLGGSILLARVLIRGAVR
jgi:hypothetical protein